MTDTTNTPTSCVIVKTVHASMRLVGGSSELLTVSQLSTVKSDICEALAIVNGQIQASQSDDQKLVIDMSDWEDLLDEGEKEDRNVPIAAKPVPLTVPGPYPISPPAMDELPEYWYIVNHGTEVRIFANNTLSTSVVAGVPLGHQVEVKSWHDAATLYNSLLSKGLIICVRA